jgi:hypothetical protein
MEAINFHGHAVLPKYSIHDRLSKRRFIRDINKMIVPFRKINSYFLTDLFDVPDISFDESLSKWNNYWVEFAKHNNTKKENDLIVNEKWLIESYGRNYVKTKVLY